MLVILVASLVGLAVGAGPRMAGSARALPLSQEAAAPGVTIAYPGRLSDDSGQAVVDGVYDFAFTLFAAEDGGEPLTFEFSTLGMFLWLALAILIATISSYLPARRAARLSVREVLTYE